MLISSGVLVSDCHGAVIYMEDSEYHCMKCLGRCNSAGTLGEQYERDNAIPKERARLEREVIRVAKALVDLYADESRRDKGEELGDLIKTVGALNKFESTHGIETKD